MGRNVKDETYLSLTLLVLRGLEVLGARDEKSAISAARVHAWLVDHLITCYGTKYIYNALWKLCRSVPRNSYGRRCRPALVNVRREQHGGVGRVAFWLREEGQNIVVNARFALTD